MTGLQDQAQKNIAYQGVMRNEATAPLVDQLRSSIMNKDVKGQEAARAGLAAAGFRDFATQDAFADQYNRELVLRSQGDKMHGAKLGQIDQDILASKANIVNQQGMLGVARSNASTNAASVNNQIKMTDYQIETGKADRASAMSAGKAQALKNGMREAGNIFADGVYNGNQATEVMEFMVKNNIGDNQEDRNSIIRNLNKQIAKGIKVQGPNGQEMTIKDLPMSYVRSAILGSKDSLLHVGWNDGYADKAVDNLKDLLKGTASTKNSAGNDVVVNKAMNDLVEWRDAIRGVEQSPVPAYPAKTPSKRSK
jgi:hypothetical protein